MISSKYFVTSEEYQHIIDANDGYPPATQYIIVDEVEAMEKDGILEKTNQVDEEGNSIFSVHHQCNYTTSTPTKKKLVSYNTTSSEPPSPPKKKKQKLSKSEQEEIQATAELFQDEVDCVPKSAPEPTEDEIKRHIIYKKLIEQPTPSIIEIDDTPPAPMETDKNVDEEVDEGKLHTTIKSTTTTGWDKELEWDVDELANVSSINSRYIYHDIYLPD